MLRTLKFRSKRELNRIWYTCENTTVYLNPFVIITTVKRHKVSPLTMNWCTRLKP